MGEEQKQKVQLAVPKQDIGAFFRQLGDELEGGCLHCGQSDFPLDQLKSLKISIKDGGEAYYVKIKAKLPKADEEPSQGDMV